MKLLAIGGIALIVAGLLALAYQTISYTRTEKVIDIGPLQATRETHRTLPLPPIVGITAVAAGVVLLVVATKRR
ncbi:MAG TPA: hypothetical protein VEK56_12415 [Vicinamibacterales bacterium]|nr:hypothetical protein [Vicinamibacterales bacterium]